MQLTFYSNLVDPVQVVVDLMREKLLYYFDPADLSEDDVGDDRSNLFEGVVLV